MGVNSISWRRIKTLNRRLNERFVHAWTLSHGEHWWWFCIRHDGTAASVNVQTGELEEDSDCEYSAAQKLLRSRNPRDTGQAEFLAELDQRAREIA